MKRLLILTCFAAMLGWVISAQRNAVEAFEIGKHNLSSRPSGKEADGIVGDFVLRNDKIEALIGGGQPLRRANMAVLWAIETPGALYDLDLRGGANDQLTAFRPGGLQGAVSYVRVVENPPPGAAAIETVRTAAKGGGVYVRHEYLLRSGQAHLEISSTYRNRTTKPREITPRAAWQGLDQEVQAGTVRVGDSIDSFDKRGYAWAPIEPRELPEKLALQPGEERTFRVALAVGDSPLAAYGAAAGVLGDTGLVLGRITDSSSAPASRAALIVTIDGEALSGYPDGDGRYEFALPAGTHSIALHDLGRESLTRSVDIGAGRAATLDWKVSPASRVVGMVRDDRGEPSPAKIQFVGRNGTPTPNFGTEYRAHGNNHQYQTHDGRFAQQVPAGDYLLRITRGPEHDLVEREITVGVEETVEVDAVLTRSVDTAGWVSTDFHAHSTPSGDNYCNTDDRLINFAAEHIEFAPTTEHNRIYDWEPHIERLGLGDKIKTVPGMELTGSGQHFNAFPLDPDPTAQDGGSPVWHHDPRINAIVLRGWDTPTLGGGTVLDTAGNASVRRGAPLPTRTDGWVQANHPDVGRVFFDQNQDGVRDGGYVGFEGLIDAAEVWSTEILNHQPTVEWSTRPGRETPNRTFFWLQMLNQGRHVWCVAVSDAHRIFGNGVGNWRTYVPSSTDEPSEIDSAEIIRNAKAGRMMISNGPFLEVQTADGLPIGSTLHAEGYIDLQIRVQASNWIDVDRVQVLVNGRMRPEFNFTAASNPRMFRSSGVRFDQRVRIPLQQDAHLIVVAVDEDSNLSAGWGLNPQGKMRPTAFTNPIYVDTGHDGFRANGDTLGHPLPTSPRSSD